MRRLITLALLLLVWTPLAGAVALDEARKLSSQIEQKTGGRIKILDDTADDINFDGPEAIGNLNQILRLVRRDPHLEKATPRDVALRIVLLLGRRTQYIASERAQHRHLRVNLAEASRRFCRLSQEPCRLFNWDLAKEICAPDPDHSRDLIW